MNRWISALFAALVVVLAAVGALCSAVISVATDETFYAEQSRAAVGQMLGTQDEDAITAYIGLDAQEQAQVAQQIVIYMANAGEGDALGLEVLNERETIHMADVRRLIALCETVRTLCVSLAAGLAVVLAWTCARIKKRVLLVGAACGAGLVLLAALAVEIGLNTAGFERLFVGMHERLFTNDLWLLNPQTDILIRMMPGTLFEQGLLQVIRLAVGAFGAMIVLLAAVYGVISGMIRRHLMAGENEQ